MASGGVDFWTARATERDYARMQARHRQLWTFVHDFIRDHPINSALEVGCGLNSPVRNWVLGYQGIDLNEATDAIHADFVTMPVDGRLCRFGLLLACGVIEHIPGGFAPFLEQVLKCKPRYALVSFFNGLERDESRFRHGRGETCRWFYALREIKAWLDARGVRYRYVALNPKDWVFIIQGE